MSTRFHARRPSLAAVQGWLLIASLLVTGIMTAAPAQAAIPLMPGDDIQAAVDANPPGTVFTLGTGLFRHQQVTPKDGQSFIGQGPATIMTGARVLTGWKKWRNKGWYVTGQTQQGQVHGECEGGYQRCDRPEDLFVDGVAFLHVGSRGQLGPGKWYFDYGADRIYVGEDPAGKTIETSVTRHAFLGDADDVSISNLIIEMYASPAQHGAIDSRTSNIGSHGSNWTVDNIEGRFNHGGAVYLTSDGTLTNSYLHHNGQQAISATGTDLLIEDNEFAFNNVAHFNLDWEGGTTKFWATTNLVFRGNNSHDNYGTGVWIDYDNSNSLIENNIVSWNYREGIFVEISHNATVRNNYVEGNGLDDPRGDSWLWSGGITVAASNNVDVYGNILVNNGNGITATQQNRGNQPDGSGPWLVENLNVHDNDVTMYEGQTGIVQDVGDHAVFTSRGNQFEGNTYRGDGQAQLFAWMDTSHTFQEWRETFGHDWSGQFISDTSDSISPVLSLIGDNPLVVGVGETFNDPGATATDNFDALASVVSLDLVDTSSPTTVDITYAVTDSSGNAAIPISRTVIVEGVGLPVVSVTGASDGAEEGLQAGSFTLTRTGDTTNPLTVLFSISGTATEGTDYGTIPHTAIFAGGASTTTVQIDPIEDVLLEGDETVTLTISSDQTYNIGSSPNATLTIADNEAPLPVVSVTGASDGAEEGLQAGSFTLTRTGDTTNPLTVLFSISGTATEGTDYLAIPAATIPGGASSATVDILPIQDLDVEGDESVILTLLASGEYAIGTPASGSSTITDNDTPPITSVFAQSETTAKGTVAGSYLDTHESDDGYEVLTEQTYAGGKRSRLEHAWTFDLGAGGSSLTFEVEAHRSGSVDSFIFEYSPDGNSWTEMLTVTKLTDDNTSQIHSLPSGLSGVLQVRVMDSDRSRNDGTKDSLLVDWMAVVSG